mgnify:CR=1 FL=1
MTGQGLARSILTIYALKVHNLASPTVPLLGDPHGPGLVDESFTPYTSAAPSVTVRRAQLVDVLQLCALVNSYAAEKLLLPEEGAGMELEDILREQILLALPMQRVCSDVCKGICPVCGKNRNETGCDCRLETVDDRWGALRDLSNR